jgi:hypothetical protein
MSHNSENGTFLLFTSAGAGAAAAFIREIAILRRFIMSYQLSTTEDDVHLVIASALPP